MSPNGIIRATSLDDLGLVEIVVPIPRPDGRTVEVPMRALSEGELWALRRSVKWPRPPVKDFRKDGNEVKPILDYQDEGYRESVNDCNRLLGQKILLASLMFYVPGKDEDEKIDQMERRMGQYAFLMLVEASQRLNVVSAEDLAQVARSFRPVGDVGAPGDGQPESDTVAMAQLIEG